MRFLFLSIILLFFQSSYAQEPKEGKDSPLIINGDNVEYSTDSKEVIASGNVEVIYKGSRLTCGRLSVNTETKEGLAEGNARLDDQRGVIEGEKIIYNFQNKTGTIVNAQFRSNPYFGRSEKVEKVSDAQFVALSGYASTCSFNKPHYRIKSKKINFFPNDKMQARGNAFYLKNTPLFYLPRYNHSLKEPYMHVRVSPGKTKDWGPFVLSAWRYNLTPNINGRIYFDYRQDLGVAEGFGANYNTDLFGKGDLKYYYTQERSRKYPESTPAEFQRYFVRLRHSWQISEQSNAILELNKISDEKRKVLDTQDDFLRDYFFREYERDSQPLSYALFHHNFRYSSMDFLVQKRVNHWFDHIEKLPEVKYSLPSAQIADSPLYFENSSSLASMNKKVPPEEENVNRFDSTQKFSLPLRMLFLQVTPFVSDRQTVYDKGADGSSLPVRTIFSSGADMSTKFFRIFNFKSKFLGMEINDLRHIITPTIGYAYTHEPTIASSDLRQIDTIDAITRSNTATLSFSNKLQTKRGGKSLDMVDVLTSTTYIFKPNTGDKLGSNFSDFLFDIKLLPYSWLRIDSDLTYKHSGNRSDDNYGRFSNANYDINFDFGKDRSFGLGERYQRKGGNEIIHSLNWRFTPKWKFSSYHRWERGHDVTLKQGIKEQQYIISRDLHCWSMDLTYNIKRGEGETIMLVCRLKAFPEMEFSLDQSYHKPKPGSQVNP
ncbi:MAG: LptA/OstA family protein [Candidatus Omnitrophota bacterium]